MNLIWTIQDSFDAAVEGVRNIIQLVNMISQVQTAEEVMKTVFGPKFFDWWNKGPGNRECF